jgi:hypothetical protein
MVSSDVNSQNLANYVFNLGNLEMLDSIVSYCDLNSSITLSYSSKSLYNRLKSVTDSNAQRIWRHVYETSFVPLTKVLTLSWHSRVLHAQDLVEGASQDAYYYLEELSTKAQKPLQKDLDAVQANNKLHPQKKSQLIDRIAQKAKIKLDSELEREFEDECADFEERYYNDGCCRNTNKHFRNIVSIRKEQSEVRRH